MEIKENPHSTFIIIDSYGEEIEIYPSEAIELIVSLFKLILKKQVHLKTEELGMFRKCKLYLKNIVSHYNPY